MHTLYTERLFIRELDQDDAPFILELLNTPTWLQFIGDRGVKNLVDARNYIENGPIKSYTSFGYGLYLTGLRYTGLPIGLCGLLRRPYLAGPDIGYALLPGHEGQGYGYEAASLVLKTAFADPSITRVFAITDPENVRSIGLLAKLGLSFQQMIQPDPSSIALMLFATA